MSLYIKNHLQASFLIILSCLLCFVSPGQTKEKTLQKMYVQFAAGPCTQNGIFGEMSIQAVLKKNWIATFSYHGIDMDPKNLPSNFERGYTIVIFFPLFDEYPSVNMKVFSFTGGKCFQTGRKTWFTTEAGLSIVTGDDFTFSAQPKVETIFSSSSNYSFKKESKTSVGGMLKADFNWAFSRYVGIGAGVFGNFSSIQTPLGFQVKLIAGWMNNKKKHS